MPLAKIDWSRFSRCCDEPKLEEVEFAIEASHEEWSGIIDRYHERWKSWQQYSTGLVQTITKAKFRGKLYPICVEFTFWKLDGHLFCHYEGSSMLVHHGLVEEYVKKMCPKVDWYSAHSNATNFHNPQSELERRLAKKKSVRKCDTPT